MGVVKKKVDNFFDPSCCTYKLNGKLRNHIDRLIKSNDVEEGTKSILIELMEEDDASKNTLSYDSIVELHKYMQRADPDYSDPFYIFSENCKCIEPKPRANQELDNRLKQLRLRHSQMMYDKMSSSVDRLVENKVEHEINQGIDRNSSSKIIYSSHNNGEAPTSQSQSSEFRRLNGSVVAVFNSFLVYICTFIFCYKALEYAIPQPNIIAQVLFGLAGSTIVALAELYFLMRVL